ncbi:MAG: phytoene desaturase family protein [Solirubrobacteraceae bacterium]
MSRSNGTTSPGVVTIVGGGLAGLVAAIVCGEAGARVLLLEAHEKLGGRARSTEGDYKANLGPHVVYKDGPFWDWLSERDLLPAHARPPMAGIRLRWEQEIHRTPPLAALPSVLRLRGRQAPVDLDFRTWAAEHTDERTAAMLSAAAGVYTFYHDPGELSAAFVWPRTIRILLQPMPQVRYIRGGWNNLVETLEARARKLGVTIQTSHRVSEVPEGPTIIATELAQAAELLGDDSLRWLSGRTLCLDLGVRKHRGDPFVVSDMDEAGWIGRYSRPDSSMAPDGEDLIQAQMPIRPQETPDQAAVRLERLLDAALPEWRSRETWRRRQVMDCRSGALDLPGKTWRDRPAIDRGNNTFLAGDMVAAPGLLGEVSWASAIQASELALAANEENRPGLRSVA